MATSFIESMEQPNYSVIIPHYNIPELLIRCIKSIPVNPDIQVIVVDDCSENADRYKDIYPDLSRPYLEFYTTTKGGSAGRARNVGIEHAKGKWLTFVDADDFLVENSLALFNKYKGAVEDVIYFPIISVMSNDIHHPSERNIFSYHFACYHKTGDEKLLRLEFDAPWGKVIKKSLVDKHHIRFDEVRYSNDTFFSAAIGYYAESIKVPEEPLYIVTERPGSLTSAKMKSYEEWTTRYQSALRVQAFFDLHHVKYKRYAFADFLAQLWKSDKKKYFKEMWRLSLRNKYRVLYHQFRILKRQ